MQYTCSDAVLDLLENYWVKTIFGYPGWAIIPFYDRLTHHKNIKHILVRNEQAAWFAAGGLARSTWKLWVCVATSWPGWTNVITSIVDAYMDSIPLLFITWQVPSNTIWKDMFQEADMTWITMNMTKNNYLIDDPKKVIEVFSEAIKIATSWRPWPVHIDFPKDIQLAEFPKDFVMPSFEIQKNEINKEKHIYDKITEDLNKAKKPILLIWHGIILAQAQKEINKFIDQTWIPTVSTLLAKWLISKKNENYLWFLWMHGFYHSNMAIANADLIINIWSRFDDRIVWTYSDFGKNAKIIHIDIDNSELNKVVKTDIAVNEDAKIFLENILNNKNLKKLMIDDWKKTIESFKEKWNYKKTTDFFSMRNVLEKIQKEIKKDLDKYIIVTDVWQHQMWASLNFDLENPHNWLTSWWAWTMGFWLPSAIWAACANKKKKVILICWDWSFQMNIQELATLKDNKLDIKIFILNNSFLWMVRQWQDMFYDKNYSQVAISSPDFEKLADSYWIKWITIKKEKQLDKNLKKILEKKWPFLANIFISKEENVFPMVPAGKKLEETIV